MKKWITAAAVLATVTASAQTKKQQDIDAIKAMCGCYEVTFDYAETFATDTNYQLHDQYHTGAPAEWVFVVEESDTKLVLQHLLVVQDSMIVKHWRQDWTYQEADLHQFHKNKTWKYESLKASDVQGQWAQEVYQVDDSPRYSGTATWVHVDGKHYWENTTDAPLPRREFTKRSDYNVMQRTNKHILTDYGWLHEQDNLKVVRENGKDKVIVGEKGLNAYHKTDKKKCQPAIDWWKEQGEYWNLVRAEWDVLLDKKEDLSLRAKQDDKMLWQALFELGNEQAEAAKSSPKKVSKEIKKVISAYQVPVAMSSTQTNNKQ